MSSDPLSIRVRHWKWTVCGLLLLATMLNYMDRLTVNILSVELKAEFGLDNEGYGEIESGFAICFALGGLMMGLMADVVSVRWLYPAAVVLWSVAGFLTGFAQGFLTLFLCRSLLGFAEAGNWPCALRTTQHILPRAERTLGNSILQSGASVGAILTPALCFGLMAWTGTWRYAFWVIGVLGLFWVMAWLAIVRSGDLPRPQSPGEESEETGRPRPGLWQLPRRLVQAIVRPGSRSRSPAASEVPDEQRDPLRPSGWQLRRFLVLVVLVVSINISWHFFRAWLPLFLREEHGYSAGEAASFLTAYYIATDLGALAAGFATLSLARRGLSVHVSRLLVFVFCALLAALSSVAAYQPRGPALLALLLVIGFGALGLFPCYYSFSQELTTRHQGKVTGMLSFSCWTSMAILHKVVGHHVDRTGSYRLGVALAGLTPLIGFAALLLFWGKEEPARAESDEKIACD